jgi:hypothetical protein
MQNIEFDDENILGALPPDPRSTEGNLEEEEDESYTYEPSSQPFYENILARRLKLVTRIVWELENLCTIYEDRNMEIDEIFIAKLSIIIDSLEKGRSGIMPRR